MLEAGYFITPHCDPECCEAFGGVSTVNLGPFDTAAEAREWSQANLGEPLVPPSAASDAMWEPSTLKHRGTVH